jgi:hypothetical protein
LTHTLQYESFTHLPKITAFIAYINKMY